MSLTAYNAGAQIQDAQIKPKHVSKKGLKFEKTKQKKTNKKPSVYDQLQCACTSGQIENGTILEQLVWWIFLGEIANEKAQIT
jgi:hypothetical protein